MKPLRQWSLLSIVALLAAMLGGVFIGVYVGGGFRDSLKDATARAEQHLDRSDLSDQTDPSDPSKRSGGRFGAAQRDDQSVDLITAMLHGGGDHSKLTPKGITQIEGRGGDGIAQQVKSHGVWFPVFDLREAKLKPSAATTTPESTDLTDYEPETVKLAEIALAIVSPPPASVLESASMSHAFAAVGGTPPYVWNAAGLPEGFALDSSSGWLTGLSREPLAATAVITVTDSAGLSASTSALIRVTPAQPLVITTHSLPNAKVSQPYRAAISVQGGVPPYTWTTNHPSWSIAEGVLTGIAAEATEFILEVTVTDAQQTSASTELTLKALDSLDIITPAALPPAALSSTYSGRFESSGGAPPYAWKLEQSSLPSSWVLDATGVLRGQTNPQEALHRFTVRVSDSAGQTFRKAFTLPARGLLIAVPSQNKVGLAWRRHEVMRVLGEEAMGYLVQRDGVEVFRGRTASFIDGPVTLGPHSYTLSAVGVSGQMMSIASATTLVLPMGKTRAQPGQTSDPYADRLRVMEPLSASHYGARGLPMNVLGPPDGRSGFAPASAESEVCSLTCSPAAGGSIVLEFTDNIIADGPGTDFTVFENVIFAGGDPNNRFMEPAIVEVALFEGEWFRFPTRVNPPAQGALNFRIPGYYAQGFAGVNATTGDDPTDPSRSGGDHFDLSALRVDGLQWVRFIRITTTGDRVLHDAAGQPIRHTAELGAMSGTGSSGFDLDAVSAVHR